MKYCLCMLNVVKEYLAKNTVYDLIEIAESDLLLNPHEWKYLLAKLGYVNNSGGWVNRRETIE